MSPEADEKSAVEHIDPSPQSADDGRPIYLGFFGNHYISIRAAAPTDERYVLGENEDSDRPAQKISRNGTSPDVSQSVETVVDDCKQVLCARECNIGNSTFVQNVAVQYDIGDCLSRPVDDFARC